MITAQTNTVNTTLASILETVKQEFKLDKDGRAFCTIRGLARLCGVDESSIREGAGKNTSKLSKFLSSKGLEGAGIFTKDGIPDIVAAVITEYYAFEAGARCTEIARTSHRAFAAIGIRVWVQKEHGWKTTPKPTPMLPTERIELAEKCVKLWKEIGMFDERDQLMIKDFTQNVLYSENTTNYLSEAPKTQIAISNRVKELRGQATLGQLSKIGREVAKRYKLTKGIEPPKHWQYVDGANRLVNSYSTEDLDLIDQVIGEILGLPLAS